MKKLAGTDVDGVRFGLIDLGMAAFYVTTVHGQHTIVTDGDWIITEPDGIHHYPCKPEIFEQSYRPIGASLPNIEDVKNA